MGRPTNTDERRAEIAQGLLQVMAKKGYEGATVADIAKAAGVASGVVHYHFADKLEILLGLIEQLAADDARAFSQHLAKSPLDPRAAIDAILDFYLSTGPTARPEVLAVWVALSGEALRQPKVRVLFERILGQLRERLVEQLQRARKEKRLVPGADPEGVAAALVALIEGYFVIAATARPLIPKGSAARTAKLLVQSVWRA